MSTESVMPTNHLILCRPLLLLPPILPRIKVFSNESTPQVRWPKWKVRHVEACPGKTPQTSSGAWLNFRGPTPCSLVQADTDPEPLDTTRRCSPRFLPYMGRPGLDPGPGYNTSPHPSYLTDSLCLLTHPPPGVLPESKHPIKAFIQGP